jgi:hypothetical protein
VKNKRKTKQKSENKKAKKQKQKEKRKTGQAAIEPRTSSLPDKMWHQCRFRVTVATAFHRTRSSPYKGN